MSEKYISIYLTPAGSLKRKSSDLEEDSAVPGIKRLCEESVEGADVDHSTREYIKNLALKLPALSPNIGLTWFKALEKEFSQDYFQEIGKFLKSEREGFTTYPPEEEVYFWTNTMEIQDVKVVILGENPHYGPNEDHGLAFSVRKGVSITPSLQNIYKELSTDIPGFKAPSHGFLYGWATQGVLLLNSILTVRAGDPLPHMGASNWQYFTNSVIKWINDNLRNTVFLLWGKDAQKKGSRISKDKHLVLTATHPSPYSARYGFYGCKHFSKANEYLVKYKKKPIDWNYLP